MAGLTVTRDNLDVKAAEAILALRNAFDKVKTIAAFLATVPQNAEGGDPLTIPIESSDPETIVGRFGYNNDEAYLLRYLFENLNSLPVQGLLDEGRKLTGLE